MFRSRRTYEEYINSLQNEVGAPPNAFNLDNEENGGDDVVVEAESGENHLHYNPALVPIPEGFNDDEEVLLIDGEGNVKILKRRLTIKKVFSLEASNKIMVSLNKFYQPVKKAGSIFNRFLSDITKRPALCPLDYKDWRLVPQYLKKKIITFIRAKFLLLSSENVDEKVLSSVGERLRWYKRCLRMKYINQQTTKEDLYNLPSADGGQENELTRPKAVGDAMWHEFVDWCFSEKFKKYSEVGKNARGLVLHAHTCGTASYAVTRDKFVKEHNREPGDIEWFIKTHKKKDNTFQEPITHEFVKTGQSEVVFSETTADVESLAYKKLMGEVTKGRVRGFGPRVTAKDLQNLHYRNQSEIMIELMKTINTMKNEIVELKAKGAEQASQHGSNCNSVESIRMPIERAPATLPGTHIPPLSIQPVPMSLGGKNTPHHAQTSKSGMPVERATATLQGTRIPPLSKQPVPISLCGETSPHHAQASKSGMPVERATATLQGTRIPPLTKQPVPMSLGGENTPHQALQPSHKRNVDQMGGAPEIGEIKRFKKVELTYQELEKVIDNTKRVREPQVLNTSKE